ncbi:hypothetical protein HYT05_02485 [Candidatus Kaiserbacteria bacterium]|nr:hypothetical protein [Candidatus Kaiserbacteria bacterium]
MSGTPLSIGRFAEFSAAVLKALPRNMSPADVLALVRNGEKLERALASALYSLAASMSEKQTLFSVIAMTPFDAIAGKKTAECFSGGIWGNRDSDFDTLLPADQPEAGLAVVSTLEPSRDWTFAEAAATVLGVPVNTPSKMLGTLLIERCHTVTLPQVELMASAAERGVQNGLRTNGYGNFFFVETINPEKPVAVGHVYRYRAGSAWHTSINGLGRGSAWRFDCRLLVRNVDISKL